MGNFISQYFWVMFLLVAAWALFCLWLGWRKRPRYPSRDEVTVLFEESWASGRSLESFKSKLIGGNNCLRVTVTTEELWIAVQAPFNALSHKLQLDHRVALAGVIDARREGKRKVIVRFEREGKEPVDFELVLRNAQRFVETLETAMVQA